MRRLDAQEIQAIAHDLNLSVSELGGLAAVASSSQESLRKHLLHAGLSMHSLFPTAMSFAICSGCAASALPRRVVPRI
jgi:hypothetical protein